MAKKEKDFGQLASQIVELVGGKDNIAHAAHCMTRLRITTKDTSLVKLDDLKKLGVIGAQTIGDQVQVIIGNEVPDVYDAFLKVTGMAREASIDENLDEDLNKKKTVKDILGSILPTIVSCVFPILPALCACGMLQAFIMILVNTGIMSASSPTVATFTWIYNVAFYFLPVLVASAAARRFNVKTAMALLMACIMIAPDFVALVAAGQGSTIPNPAGGPPTVVPGSGNAGYVFGLPIYPATYSNTILPIIMCVFIMGYLEKYLNKWVPKAFRFVFVPLIEMLIMVPVGLAIVGPIGARLSVLLGNLLIMMFRTLGPFAPTLLTIFMPFIILTGMHFNLMAVAMAMASVTQKNVVTHPAFFLTQAAQGAACLAVALKTKDPERRSLGLSSSFSDYVPGISEPGMYGITLKYKTPMIASMIGSGIGAFIGSLMNVGSYAGGPPNLFTLPLFINPATGDATDMRNIIICMVIASIITFGLTWFMYNDAAADEIDAKG